MQIGNQAFITMVIADETDKVLFASSDTNMVGAPGIKLMIENNPGDLMFVPMADGSVEVVNVKEAGNRIPTCAMGTTEFLNRGRDRDQAAQEDFVTLQSGDNGIVVSEYDTHKKPPQQEEVKAAETEKVAEEEQPATEETVAEKSNDDASGHEDSAVETEVKTKDETESVVTEEEPEEQPKEEPKKKQKKK